MQRKSGKDSNGLQGLFTEQKEVQFPDRQTKSQIQRVRIDEERKREREIDSSRPLYLSPSRINKIKSMLPAVVVETNLVQNLSDSPANPKTSDQTD